MASGLFSGFFSTGFSFFTWGFGWGAGGTGAGWAGTEGALFVNLSRVFSSGASWDLSARRFVSLGGFVSFSFGTGMSVISMNSGFFSSLATFGAISSWYTTKNMRSRR